MPIYKYWECDCDGDLNALIIEGEATEQELREAWTSIKAQYADAMANKKFVSFKSLFKQIGVMRLTLMQVELLINILRNVYHEDIAARLNKELKASFQFNPADKSKYLETLEALTVRIDTRSLPFFLQTPALSFRAACCQTWLRQSSAHTPY